MLNCSLLGFAKPNTTPPILTPLCKSLLLSVLFYFFNLISAIALTIGAYAVA